MKLSKLKQLKVFSSEIIREKLKNKNINELSRKTKISRQTLYSFRDGVRTPNLSTIIKVQEALNL